MNTQQQKDILDHTYDLITAFNNGNPPKGSVAPSWETSKEQTELLLERGLEYGLLSSRARRGFLLRVASDHSAMAHE